MRRALGLRVTAVSAPRAFLWSQAGLGDVVAALGAEAAAGLHGRHFRGGGSVGFRDHKGRFFLEGERPAEACGVEGEKGGAIPSGKDIAEAHDAESGGLDQRDGAGFLGEGEAEDKDAVGLEVPCGGSGVIPHMAPEFEAGVGLLGIGGEGPAGEREVGRASGDEGESVGQVECAQIGVQRGDAPGQPVALDVGAEETVADVLRLDAGERGGLGKSAEDDESDGSNAATEIEAMGCAGGLLQGVPGGGGVVDGVPMAALSLENAPRPGEAADEDGKTQLRFEGSLAVGEMGVDGAHNRMG